MNKIPLWGKIVGGCGVLFILFLLVAGCVGIVALSSSDPEPTSQPTTVEVTEEAPEPTEEETTEPEPEPTEEETPEVDTTGGINTCIPDQEQSMAEVVADFTSADVTIYTDQVYVVAEDADLNSFYVVAGSDVGTIILYIESVNDEDPMGYAANDIAYDYTMLVYPEELGADPIDMESDTYQVAEGCVS